MAKPGSILPLAIRQTIKAMRAGGATVREVARVLSVNRNTASKYGRPTVGQDSGRGAENR